jgi:hypothetical protein
VSLIAVSKEDFNKYLPFKFHKAIS